MSLISTSVPNLVGGVSQQPPSLRLPNQCERQENALASAFEGLIKRPPAEHVAVLKASGVDISYDSAYVHMIDRDATERYVVVFGRTNGSNTTYIKVYDINGTEKTVHTPDGTGYINEADIDTKLRCITVADVTFVLNRNKTVLAAADKSPQTRNITAPTGSNVHQQALLWVRQTNYGRNYSFTITANGVPYSYFYSTGTQSSDAIGTDLIATKLAEGSTYSGNGLANASFAAGVTQITIDTHSGTAPAAGVKIVGRGIAPGTTVSSATQNAGVHTINLSKALIGPLADNAPVFFWTAAATIQHGYSADPISGIGYKVSNNIIWIYADNYANTFSISTSDDFGGEGISLSTTEVASFDDLPDSAPHNYLVRVVGSGGNESDDYWVVFQQSGATSSSEIRPGYWKESMAPGLEYKFNKTTMPHILVRESNGDFRFKQADGTTYPDFDWLPRVVGDEETSPFPSFVGQKIRDINFFRDRLVVLSGEYITLSETGDPFNFWVTTVENVVDSDSIELGSTQPSVMDFKSSVVFSDRLVAFTPQAQLTLKGDTVLSPKTISLTQSASFENLDTQPIASGTSIFFGFNRGSFSGLREMVVSNSLDLQFDAIDITVQVPQYLSGTVKKIVASTHENYVIALCSGEPSALYVYKYYNQGDQRIQSAWGKFTFTDATILDIQFLDTTLYVVLKRGATTVIERLRMESGRKDVNSTYVTSLDRRIGAAQCVSATYDAGTNRTTYVLPYTITTNAVMAVVTTSGLSLQTTQVNTTTLRVPGNYTTGVWIGSKYTMVYEFSEQVLKAPSQTGGMATITTGRYQIRYGSIAYGNSAYFKVKIIIDAGSTYEYAFTGRTMGALNNAIGSVSLDSGSFRFPVYSRNSQVKISIENDSPLPSNLLSAEYEALFSDRTQRR